MTGTHITYAHVLNGPDKGRAITEEEMRHVLKDDTLGWVHIDGNHPDAEAWIGEHLDYLDPQAVEALVDRASRPRLTRLGDGLMIILRAINFNEGADPEDMISLRIWADAHRIVTVSLRRVRAIERLDARLSQGEGPETTGAFLVALIEDLTGKIGDFQTDLDAKAEALEEQIIAESGDHLRGEVVNAETRTHTLIDAQLQLAPYSDPCFDIAVAAVASPTGPRMAGQHGVGLLSIGATLTQDGFDALAHHWSVVEESAAHHGQPAPDRSTWRLVGLMHVAETREQAYREVEYGIEHWFRYFQKVAAFPQMAVAGGDVKEMIDFINDAGIGAIGTVEDAKAQVQKLVDQSGGFGAFLLLGHEWANPVATKRSYELIAQHVMPEFQGQAAGTLAAPVKLSAGKKRHALVKLAG